MGILFGTDGIRGVAGRPPLDPDSIYHIGCCLTDYLKTSHRRPRILIARDTRESGPWIAGMLQRAIDDTGGMSENCGVLSTPAVSYLTSRLEAQAGIVISASHNPYEDNGIKIFSSTGIKFNDSVEEELERKILSSAFAASRNAEPPAAQPAFESVPQYRDLYTRHLLQCLPEGFRLDGLNLAVDCANGALSDIAPELLRRMGADVHAIHHRPDGRNINLDSGALHIESLSREVRARGADLGVAFDGDADRAMFVDREGKTRDGDDVLYLLARYSISKDAPRTVVGTVMANLGLEIALENLGFGLVRTPVGDRYVLEEMLRSGAALGGEQSGHVIIAKLAHTGDGLLTALKVLEVLRAQKKDIADLCSPIRRFPQILENVRVKKKVPFADIPGLREAEEMWRKKLGDRSRILLRYSGTEPLARVMVEGRDETAVREAANQLASFFKIL